MRSFTLAEMLGMGWMLGLTIKGSLLIRDCVKPHVCVGHHSVSLPITGSSRACLTGALTSYTCQCEELTALWNTWTAGTCFSAQMCLVWSVPLLSTPSVISVDRPHYSVLCAGWCYTVYLAWILLVGHCYEVCRLGCIFRPVLWST